MELVHPITHMWSNTSTAGPDAGLGCQRIQSRWWGHKDTERVVETQEGVLGIQEWMLGTKEWVL